MNKFLVGDTMKLTWINSGQTANPIIASIFNGSDSLVNSVSMSSSGDGHYFSNYTLPNTPGFYVAETLATIAGLPYKNRTRFKVITGETD